MSLTSDRRGFSLPDVLMGVILLGMIGGVVTVGILRATRLVGAERESTALRAAFDASLGFLTAELEEIEDGDLISAAPDAILYRAIRVSGHACRVDPGEVRVLRDRLRSTRLPQPGRDSLLVMVATDTGMVWLPAPILGVSNSSCGAGPALRLATTLDTIGLDPLPAGELTPFRTFEIMEARLYSSSGARWLGARSVSAGENIQPLTGPFDSAARFSLLDAAGTQVPPSLARSASVLLSGTRRSWNGGYPAREVASRVIHLMNRLP